MADRITLGLDIGSAASKALLLRGGEIVATAVFPGGAGTAGPERARAAVLRGSGLEPADVAFTVGTGYGRNRCGADDTVSELSCHAAGAHALFPEAKTVVDIGGQDLKVLHIGPGGALEDFLMNDKCAAGTGRFLEVMANVLQLPVSELEAAGQAATEVAAISSTCTVFAESEAISRLAENVPIPNLVAGIHASVAARAAALTRRLGLCAPVVMTGGVAQNGGVVAALSRALDTPVAVSPLSQLCGAYGAAIYAVRKYDKLSHADEGGKRNG